MDRPGKPGFGWLFKFCLQTGEETGRILKINENPVPSLPFLMERELLARLLGCTPCSHLQVLTSMGEDVHTGAAPEPHQSQPEAIPELHTAPQGMGSGALTPPAAGCAHDLLSCSFEMMGSHKL